MKKKSSKIGEDLRGKIFKFRNLNREHRSIKMSRFYNLEEKIFNFQSSVERENINIFHHDEMGDVEKEEYLIQTPFEVQNLNEYVQNYNHRVLITNSIYKLVQLYSCCCISWTLLLTN